MPWMAGIISTLVAQACNSRDGNSASAASKQMSHPEHKHPSPALLAAGTRMTFQEILMRNCRTTIGIALRIAINSNTDPNGSSVDSCVTVCGGELRLLTPCSMPNYACDPLYGL